MMAVKVEEGFRMISGAPAPRQGRKLPQYRSAIGACFPALGVGTVLGLTSFVLPELEQISWLEMSMNESSWIASLLAIGAMLGALPSGCLANALGRKRSLFLPVLPFLASLVITACADNVWMLYAARLLVGLGAGATCVLVPTYLSEIAEASVRGSLGALFQLFLTVGILIAAAMASSLHKRKLINPRGLEKLLAVGFLSTGFFLFLPESPAWLMSKSRKADASAALKRLRGKSYDIDSELLQLEKEVAENASKRNSVFDLVRLPVPRKALFICFAGMIFQQLSGINAVIFYTVDIFKAAKSSLDPTDANMLVVFVQCVMSVVAAGIVDKAGRKPLLIFSSVVMSGSLVALGLFFKLQDNELGTDIGWLPVVSLFAFMVAFSVGMGPIPWLLMGELFTVEHKGNASSLVVMLYWFLDFLVTMTFPTSKDLLNSSGTFWVYAAIMALAALFMILVMPETKGKTIQEIQTMLAGRGGGNRNRTT